MRYFLVSYTAQTSSAAANGNIFFPLEHFPNKKWIMKNAALNTDLIESTVVVQNIFEFKSKQDFESFQE